MSLHATTLRRDTVPDDEEDPYYLLCGQADAAIKDGKFDEAAARLIDAMSVRPDSPQNILLLSNLGMVYSYMGRDSLALATLDEALRRAPSMRTVLSNRAHVLLNMGRDSEAMRDFTAVIASDSLNTDARFTTAQYRYTMATSSRLKKIFRCLKVWHPTQPTRLLRFRHFIR